MLTPPDMPPREPHVENHGIFALHDQRCAVYSGQSAVLELGEGVFHPSWKAQGDGWQLVHADTRFKRWLVRTFLRRGVDAMSIQNFIYFLAVLGWLHLIDFVVDIGKVVWRFAKRALMVTGVTK